MSKKNPNQSKYQLKKKIKQTGNQNQIKNYENYTQKKRNNTE